MDQLFPYIASCLLSVIAWIGVGIHTDVKSIWLALHHIEIDLRGKLADLDRRVAVLESEDQNGN